MKFFILKIIIFFFLVYFSSEIVIYSLKLKITPPLAFQDSSSKIIKYYPNQNLTFTNGNSFNIGPNGNTGQQGKICNNCPSYSVIGDSYIEALMNPHSCHQSVLLQQKITSVNFTSRALSGITFITMLEMASELDKEDSINLHLIYLNELDIIGSFEQFNTTINFTYNFKTNKIDRPIFDNRKAYLKYQFADYFAFPYYIYRKNLASNDFNKKTPQDPKNKFPNKNVSALLKILKKHYNFSKILLILKPETDKEIDVLLEQNNINYLRLISQDYSKWKFKDDPHWNCYGHQQASEQVVKYLLNTTP
jgi:hypothetical protein